MLEELLTTAAKEIPSMAVLTFIVFMFLRYAKEGAKDFREYLERRDEALVEELAAMRFVLQEILKRVGYSDE